MVSRFLRSFLLRSSTRWIVAAACGWGLPSCSGEAARPGDPAPIAVVDDAERAVGLAQPARRVVSLVPSVTETIVALGAGERLVARTDYDTAPELARLPSLGGGLDASIEAVIDLEPDFVVVWDARDDAGLRARLEAAGIPVYAAAIQDTAAVFATVRRLGILLGRESAADSLAGALRDTLDAIAAEVGDQARPRVLFLLDDDPPRIAGPGTFISQLVEVAGGRPAFEDVTGEWPIIALEAIVADSPDVVLVSVIPGEAPALTARAGWRSVPAVREDRVIGLPADLVSRPGPLIGRAARAMRDSLHALAARMAELRGARREPL
jgi:iron complex transport system substrate-binding protein